MIAPSSILDFYFQHNFRLVFWPQIGDSKGPHERGWTERVYTREDYRDGMRVGIMCGHELSSGKFLHDVDIDWADGAQIAQSLLPATDFMYGRTSKRISHCWYTLSEALPSFKYIDPIDQSITYIELRGVKLDGTLGNQTMAPPSVWSKENNKEQLAFVRMQLPAHIDVPSGLKQRVCLCAISMCFARHFGRKGFGHEQRLAWAGFLLRAGLSIEECTAIGNAIMLYTGNADRTDIKLAIETTKKRLDDKEKKVKGGPALAKLLGENGRAVIKRINEWLGRDSDFIRDGNGLIVKDHQENISRALTMLNVELTFNEFSDKLLVGRTTPLEDRHLNELWFRIDEEFRFRPSYDFFEKVIKRIAWNNGFHPVKEYLATLQWDNVPRINRWLIESAGAEESDYVQAISAIVLIAAVRRIKQPGCKYDEMIVLESSQGLQKSSALRALCPNPEWFSDDFELNATSQRIIESTIGKWLVEAQELSGMSKAQSELLKSNLSRQIDGPARMAYARLPIERARQFVMIGTTNSKAYLADSTGARRFWPVDVSRFDVAWIIEHRDQLWAEAAHREALGESNRLPESLWAAAGEAQESRREIDPWEPLVKQALISAHELHDYHDRHSRVVTSFLWNAVNVQSERRTRREETRMSEILQRLGFRRTKVRPAGEVVQVGYVSKLPDWTSVIEAEDHIEEMHARAVTQKSDDDTPY